MDPSQSGGPNGRPQGQGGGRPDGAPRRNRNRNRNRNRSDRERNGGRDSYENKENRSGKGGGGKRNDRPRDDREFRPRGPKPTPKPTLGQRILSILTFGLLGQPKPAPARRATENRDRPERPERPERERSASTEGPRREPREDRPPRNRDREDRPPREPREPRPDREDRPARSPKPPVTVEVTSARLYVGNLDYEAQEQDLEDLFRGVGTVASAEIVTNPRTQQSKGFAFVEMSHIEEARRAVEVLHDKDFMGRKLLVTGAKSEGPREDEDEENTPSNSATGEETAAA